MANTKSMREMYPYGNKFSGDVIGIEIEMEGSGLATLQERMDALHTTPSNMWYQKGDGSLRGESCEWVLRKPVDALKAYEWLDRLWYHADLIKGVRFTPSRRCGVHVHVNCQELTQKQVYNFISVYLLFENILLRWAGKEREGNFFCLRGMDARYLSARLAHHRDSTQWRDLPDEMVRYAALNVGALFRYGSLEFRALPTPSKSPQVIKDWANMMLQCKAESLKVKNPKEIVQKFSQIGATEYMVRVFGAHTPLLKVAGVPELGKQGMRNLQDVLLLQPAFRADNVAKDGHWYAGGEHPDDILDMLAGEEGPMHNIDDDVLEELEEDIF